MHDMLKLVAFLHQELSTHSSNEQGIESEISDSRRISSTSSSQREGNF